MTTQIPYQQQYPTAPPWANPPAAEPDPAAQDQAAPSEAVAPGYGAVTPWGAPYQEHGQLLVPFPEEMHTAARAEPPAWWPVLIWTFFFGVFGLVSASRRANQARRGRNSPAPYWIAWAATSAVLSVLGAVVAVAAVPAYLAYREDAVTKVVQEKIMTDGRLQASAHVTATTANCEPIGPRDTSGARRYDCVLSLDDGRTGSLIVTADESGNWTAITKKK
jgi:hypothetical protein